MKIAHLKVSTGNQQVKKSLIAAPAAAFAVIGIGLAPTANAANPETVDLFTATVNEMAAKYGTGPIPVEVGPPRGDVEVQETVAQADHGRAIVLNEEYANLSPQEFTAKMAANIANGFSPGGCDGGVRMAAIHEVGHILDHRKMLAGDNRRNAVGMAVQSGQISKDTLTREVHPQALQGDKVYAPEMMAVAFEAAECLTATPTEQKIHDILVG